MPLGTTTFWAAHSVAAPPALDAAAAEGMAAGASSALSVAAANAAAGLSGGLGRATAAVATIAGGPGGGAGGCAVYEGETLPNGAPHGYGTAVYTNGLMYEGTWSHGRECGWGVLTDGSDAPLYRGEVSDGAFNGGGTFFFGSGDCYSGGWREGLPHGRGVFSTPCGSGYDGDWVEGQRHGQGSQYYADGSVYTGAWHAGQRHGRGEIVFMPPSSRGGSIPVAHASGSGGSGGDDLQHGSVAVAATRGDDLVDAVGTVVASATGAPPVMAAASTGQMVSDEAVPTAPAAAPPGGGAGGRVSPSGFFPTPPLKPLVSPRTMAPVLTLPSATVTAGCGAGGGGALARYKGQWVCDTIEGRGEAHYFPTTEAEAAGITGAGGGGGGGGGSMGSSYEGVFHNGLRHGRGTYSFTAQGGAQYSGRWARDGIESSEQQAVGGVVGGAAGCGLPSPTFSGGGSGLGSGVGGGGGGGGGSLLLPRSFSYVRSDTGEVELVLPVNAAGDSWHERAGFDARGQ